LASASLTAVTPFIDTFDGVSLPLLGTAVELGAGVPAAAVGCGEIVALGVGEFEAFTVPLVVPDDSHPVSANSVIAKSVIAFLNIIITPFTSNRSSIYLIDVTFIGKVEPKTD
jgi:hypothetical protein